jgi:hypothetical protein
VSAVPETIDSGTVSPGWQGPAGPASSGYACSPALAHALDDPRPLRLPHAEVNAAVECLASDYVNIPGS